MKIIGLGNALVDIALRIESDEVLHKVGITKGAMDMIEREKMLSIHTLLQHIDQRKAPGGAACNSMRALAHLGHQSGFIGKIGTDSLGDFYEKALADVGVSPFFVKTNEETGRCTVLVSPCGERTMATYLGPAPTLLPEDITEEVLSSYDLIYIEGYLLVNEPLVRSVMQRAKAMGMKVALDLANFNIVNAFRDLLNDLVPKYVDILFSNESEANAFTGLPAEEAVKEIQKMVDISLVTLGKKGILIGHNGTTSFVPSGGAEPVDTTGAGDNFAAGFLYGLSTQASLEKSARIGAILAEYVIGVMGPEIPNEQWDKVLKEINKL